MADIRQQLALCANSKQRKLLLKELRKLTEKENQKYPADSFVEVSVSVSDKFDPSKLPVKAYRSKDYLVQIYNDKGFERISVNSVYFKDDGHWCDGISWDTLMWIKDAIGYGDYDAVEVYPKTANSVNVANFRHLFVLKEPLPFIWQK